MITARRRYSGAFAYVFNYFLCCKFCKLFRVKEQGCTGFIAGCGHTDMLLELPAEMLCILVAAKLGYLIYGVVTVGNIIFGKLNAASEDIFHAGDTKGLFIHYMQVARAYI